MSGLLEDILQSEKYRRLRQAYETGLHENSTNSSSVRPESSINTFRDFKGQAKDGVSYPTSRHSRTQSVTSADGFEGSEGSVFKVPMGIAPRKQVHQPFTAWDHLRREWTAIFDKLAQSNLLTVDDMQFSVHWLQWKAKKILMKKALSANQPHITMGNTVMANLWDKTQSGKSVLNGTTASSVNFGSSSNYCSTEVSAPSGFSNISYDVQPRHCLNAYSTISFGNSNEAQRQVRSVDIGSIRTADPVEPARRQAEDTFRHNDSIDLRLKNRCEPLQSCTSLYQRVPENIEPTVMVTQLPANLQRIDEEASILVKSATSSNKENEKLRTLKNWTLVKSFNPDKLQLLGQLIMPNGEVKENSHMTETVVSRSGCNLIKTKDAIYYLEGPLIDPNNVIPEAVKKAFSGPNGFPIRWRKQFVNHWRNETVVDEKNNGSRKKAQKDVNTTLHGRPIVKSNNRYWERKAVSAANNNNSITKGRKLNASGSQIVSRKRDSTVFESSEDEEMRRTEQPHKKKKSGHDQASDDGSAERDFHGFKFPDVLLGDSRVSAFSPGAALRSAKKSVCVDALGKATPPTKSLGKLFHNSISKERDERLTPHIHVQKSKHVAKRMIKVSKKPVNHRKKSLPGQNAVKPASKKDNSEVDKLLGDLIKPTCRTPVSVQQVFRTEFKIKKAPQRSDGDFDTSVSDEGSDGDLC